MYISHAVTIYILYIIYIYMNIFYTKKHGAVIMFLIYNVTINVTNMFAYSFFSSVASKHQNIIISTAQQIYTGLQTREYKHAHNHTHTHTDKDRHIHAYMQTLNENCKHNNALQNYSF